MDTNETRLTFQLIQDICQIDSGEEMMRITEEIVSFGFRRHGTDEEKRAAFYLKAALEDAGLEDVVYEKYPIPAYRPGKPVLQLFADGKTYDIPCGPVWFAGSGDVRAAVCDMGYGLCEESAWQKTAGKIIFLRSNIMGNVSPMHDSVEPCTIADQVGAAGVVLATDFPYDLRTRYVDVAVEDADIQVPAVIISNDDRVFVEEILTKAVSPVEMRVFSDGETYMDESGDVVGCIHGTEDRLYLICHYDSTEYGATDNAAAEAGFIMTARKLAKLPFPHPTIVFIGHSAHESFHGVKTYVKRHEDEIRKGFLCINYDGFLSPGHFRSTQGIVPASYNDYKMVFVSNNPLLVGIALRALKRNSILPSLISPQDELASQYANGDSEGAFAIRGVPILSAGGHNVWYHTDLDTVDKTTASHLLQSYRFHIDMIAEAIELGPAAIRGAMCADRDEALAAFIPRETKRLDLCDCNRGILFDMAPQPAKTGEPVQFYYMLAVDSEEVIVDYWWDFGDGQTSKDVFTRHVYERPGRYAVRFTCVDAKGYEFSAKRHLWVYS